MYLERYANGECREVWEELYQLGDSAYDDAIWPDVSAVVRETMRRARENVRTLVGELESIGYLFGVRSDGSAFHTFKSPHIDPVLNTDQHIQKLERQAGAIPLSMRMWWEVVGEVDFRGHHPQLGLYSDPLLVYSVECALEDFDEWSQTVESDGIEETGPFRITIAPDFYHKDDVSGGSPYQMSIGTPCIDALVLNECRGVKFVNYLRECFRWGGFPGLERSASGARHPIARLGQNLLPL
jgi:hypothetical protein